LEPNYDNKKPYYPHLKSFIDDFEMKNTFRFSKCNFPNVYVINVEIPGFNLEDISVKKINNNIAITACSNHYEKEQIIHIPFAIDLNKLKVKYTNGLLSILLEKT
jgi:HSP20 family molecular chaperone IbpA